MKVFLRLSDIRTLLHELRRQTQGQFLRQLNTRKLKLLRQILAGEAARERSQEVTLLSQLLEERRQRGGDLRELRFLRRHIKLAHISFGILAAQNFQDL